MMKASIQDPKGQPKKYLTYLDARGIADVPGAARAPVRCSSHELPQTKCALSVALNLNEEVT